MTAPQTPGVAEIMTWAAEDGPVRTVKRVPLRLHGFPYVLIPEVGWDLHEDSVDWKTVNLRRVARHTYDVLWAGEAYVIIDPNTPAYVATRSHQDDTLTIHTVEP